MLLAVCFLLMAFVCLCVFSFAVCLFLKVVCCCAVIVFGVPAFSFAFGSIVFARGNGKFGRTERVNKIHFGGNCSKSIRRGPSVDWVKTLKVFLFLDEIA